MNSFMKSIPAQLSHYIWRNRFYDTKILFESNRNSRVRHSFYWILMRHRKAYLQNWNCFYRIANRRYSFQILYTSAHIVRDRPAHATMLNVILFNLERSALDFYHFVSIANNLYKIHEQISIWIWFWRLSWWQFWWSCTLLRNYN